MKQYKWVIDAGHGGADSGAVQKNSQGVVIRKESNDCLKIALMVRDYLEKHNQLVTMTRTTDTTMSLSERTRIENKGNYDFYVSIHRNSATNPLANGVETFSYDIRGKGNILATNIQNELKSLFYNRGVKTANFHVLRETKCSACLVELGFIINNKDNDIFDKNFDKIVRSIVTGCLKTVNIKPNFNISLSDTSNTQSNTGSTSSNTHGTPNIYRVIKDGVQIGAYSNIDNVILCTKSSLEQGVNKIEIIKK